MEQGGVSNWELKRASIVGMVPRWYSPGVHLAIPTVLGTSVMIVAVALLSNVRAVELVAVPLTFLFGWAFEWRVHKSVLHQKQPLLEELYVRHELHHHVVFTYDDLAMRNKKELWLILMPAYAIVLVSAMITPFALLTAHFASQNAGLLVIVASMVFFLTYEWLHMIYHLSPDSVVGRVGLIRLLREHHRRHHEPRLQKRWNFNVTFPLFDWILRTVWSPEREKRRGKAEIAAPSGGAASAPEV